MNYKALTSMVDWLVNNYLCPSCDSKINAENIDIVWAAWNNVNIDIECPKCKNHSMVKSQIIQLDMQNIQKLRDNLNQTKTKNSIKDSQIVELSKDLKARKLKVEDLFN